MAISKLPWSTSEYVALQRADLEPMPAPSPEQRIRVASVLATIARDRAMLGLPVTVNSEAIRNVLVMDAAAWEKHIPHLVEHLRGHGWDPVGGEVRFRQIREKLG